MRFNSSFKGLSDVFINKRLTILRSRDRASWHVTVHRDMWPCIVTNFLTIKPTRCTDFSKLYFGMKLYTFRTVSLSIIRSYSLYTQQRYVIQVCRQIPLLSVQWITPDDGQRNCPKQVEFHFQNKFEKLVHLVGFIIRKQFTSLQNCFDDLSRLCQRNV
jgi:hypothetical protein